MIKRFLNIICSLTIILILQFCNTAHAATNCSFSMTPVEFGNLTTTEGSGWREGSFGTLSASCTSTESGTVFICQANMGTSSPKGLPLEMVGNETNGKISYTLAKSFWFGDFWGIGQDMTNFEFPVSIGTESKSYTVSAAIAQDQSLLSVDTYSAIISGANSLIMYAFSANGEDRDTACSHATATHADFTVSATVKARCRIQASTLAFPPIGSDTNGSRASFSITHNCTRGTSGTIYLESPTGPDPSGMKVLQHTTGDISKKIYYETYKLDSCSGPWGDRSTMTGRTFVSEGGGETITGCARILPQVYPMPGEYTGILNGVFVY